MNWNKQELPRDANTQRNYTMKLLRLYELLSNESRTCGCRVESYTCLALPGHHEVQQ